MIVAWTALLALVFASAGTSARPDVSPKPHVGGIDLAVDSVIGVNALASAEEHRGKRCLPTTATSDVPLAARGAGPKLLTAGKTVPNAGGKIISFVTDKPRTFFRVFSSYSTRGAFLTSVRPTSSAFARETLALPPGNAAFFVQKVVVPAGTRLQRSRALPAFGRRGGAEQFQLLEQIPNSSFGSGVPLP